MTSPEPTMADLYPDGRGYHQAHEPYIAAVAAALDAAGFPTADCYADPNDPRDGAIQLDLTRQGTIDGEPIWRCDEVWVGWQEERGWTLLTVTKYDEPRFNKGNWDTDSRYVYDLDCPLVASPVSVVLAVAEHARLTLELDDDGHPDVDFPGHSFEDDNVPLELALRRYAECGPYSSHGADCAGCTGFEDRWREQVAASGVTFRPATDTERRAADEPDEAEGGATTHA